MNLSILSVFVILFGSSSMGLNPPKHFFRLTPRLDTGNKPMYERPQSNPPKPIHYPALTQEMKPMESDYTTTTGYQKPSEQNANPLIEYPRPTELKPVIEVQHPIKPHNPEKPLAPAAPTTGVILGSYKKIPLWKYLTIKLLNYFKDSFIPKVINWMKV